MTTPITSWDASDEYKKIRDVVKKLSVINDHAERGVALIKAYSGYLTNISFKLLRNTGNVFQVPKSRPWGDNEWLVTLTPLPLSS